MIEAILPDPVRTEHRYVDVTDALVFPAEQEQVARAVDKRRREFTTTRLCARTALARLGVGAGPVLSGPRGDPRWPPAVVGSLTHCDGYRAASVAWSHDVAALGIDAEPNDVLPEGVLDLVTRADERAMLRALPTDTGVSWDRLLFSAKESIFKAWYPVTGRELSFREASVRLHGTAAGTNGTFSAFLLVPDSPFGDQLSGRWMSGAGLVLSSVVITTHDRGR
ncbi:MAG: 4'-phosphopantetheinyl transferase superfamily protein [Geodermatophilaceae bacterium]|nr:4'-phosphopantetheinyl transferase superfamily protein [Geodermatophilaceae bacterium]